MSTYSQHEHKAARRRAKGRRGKERRSGRGAGEAAPVRLQRYLAECGVASRRRAEELIADGYVTVNREVVRELGAKVVPGRDTVTVKNRPVKPLPKGIVLFHKPKHVVSTMSDPEGRPTVADYLTPQYRSFFPVGRLDWDSTGLLVFTNDGELSEHLLHPRYESEKVYEVEVQGRVANGVLENLERGVKLDDGPARARVKVIRDGAATTVLELRLREGRNRIVRRMMERVGHRVIELKRTAMGPFRLGTLRPGEMKRLTEREYGEVRSRILSSGEGRPSTVDRSGQRGARRDHHESGTPGRRRANRGGSSDAGLDSGEQNSGEQNSGERSGADLNTAESNRANSAKARSAQPGSVRPNSVRSNHDKVMGRGKSRGRGAGRRRDR